MTAINTKLRVRCHWCGCGDEPDYGGVFPPCGPCVTAARRVIEASEAPADKLLLVANRYNTAIDGLKAAKREMRKAEKAAKKQGLSCERT